MLLRSHLLRRVVCTLSGTAFLALVIGCGSGGPPDDGVTKDTGGADGRAGRRSSKSSSVRQNWAALV
ncbi:MAG TPA: hypothetical protein VKE74_32300, partial [Gemmataceae bacterium]|nr:hypothetical protein [Gemmataceae bacterium]